MSETAPAGGHAQWDKVADEYERRVQPLTGSFAAPLLDLVGGPLADAEVLDVACGTGALALEAARRGARVMACDGSPKMVAITAGRAAEHGLHVAALACDGGSLPAAWSGRFDVALSCFGVIFFADFGRGVRELVRTLKPGGRLAICAWGSMDETPAFAVLPEAAAALARARASHASPALRRASRPPSRKSLREVEAALRSLGLAAVRVHGPIRRTLRTPSAQAYWERFALGAPGTRALLASLPANEAGALRAGTLEALCGRFGGEQSEVSLEAAAYVVTAARPLASAAPESSPG